MDNLATQLAICVVRFTDLIGYPQQRRHPGGDDQCFENDDESCMVQGFI